MLNETMMKAGRLVFLLVLIFAIGAVGGAFVTPESMKWYNSLPLAPYNPPSYIFGIVWSFLYVFMAVSAFLVWGKASPRYFVFSLMAILLWTFLFFYLRSPILALIDTVLLIAFNILTIKEFYKYSKISAYLLIPLLLWSLYALYLNAYLVII